MDLEYADVVYLQMTALWKCFRDETTIGLFLPLNKTKGAVSWGHKLEGRKHEKKGLLGRVWQIFYRI